MNILVLNSGSSSLKFQLIATDIERIAEDRDERRRDIPSDTWPALIHEYKRQLLNALRVVVLYNRLRENPNLEKPPRTFFFAGKAAPAYHLAKLIIKFINKFINNLAGTIDGNPAVRERIKVLSLPDYCVSLAERLIPASDVSNIRFRLRATRRVAPKHEIHDEWRTNHRY